MNAKTTKVERCISGIAFVGLEFWFLLRGSSFKYNLEYSNFLFYSRVSRQM